MLPCAFASSPATGKRLAGRALVVFVSDALKLSAAASRLDASCGGAITRAIAASAFKGKKGQTLLVPGIEGSAYDRALLVGLGAEKDLTATRLEETGGEMLAALNACRTTRAEILCEGVKTKDLKESAAAAHLLHGAHLRSYRFAGYKSKKKPEDAPALTALSAIVKDSAAASKAYAALEALASGVALTRDVVSEPPNLLTPKALAERCRQLTKLGVKVEVLGVAQMKKLGMGALLGVGQGSAQESQLVVMQWNGGKKSQKPVALIGKGVCFDSGGISIKPSNGMEEMKWDMAGAGAVLGTMRALAARKAKVNVVGVVGLVENMPDGNAQRPSDVVTSMSGQTIEVLNTDAEGRLVLADAVWYTQQRFKPQCMVDLATLTGAIIVSLGSHRAGLFTENDKLARALESAGEDTGERLWRMPMGEEYDAMINCDIADMKNISDGREAGSTTAAHFIGRFTNNVPWAHLDIAGVAWDKKAKGYLPGGATGWGVRLLNRWIAEEFEG